jgi:hypothetical protein
LQPIFDLKNVLEFFPSLRAACAARVKKGGPLPTAPDAGAIRSAATPVGRWERPYPTNPRDAGMVPVRWLEKMSHRPGDMSVRSFVERQHHMQEPLRHQLMQRACGPVAAAPPA